jgi:RNA polymerase-binding transcription factor DksA
MLDQKTINELKTALEKEQELLISELKTIATPDPNLKDDWNVKHEEWGEDQITSEEDLETGESVNESDEDMKNKALSDHLELRLKEVNDALKRVEDGTYGICRACKNPIPIERLRANPAAETDIEHKKEIHAG